MRDEFGRASDAKLLRAGTADGFEEVYVRHAAQVLAWSRARVGERVAELTAAVFERAWPRRSRFRRESDVSALSGGRRAGAWLARARQVRLVGRF